MTFKIQVVIEDETLEETLNLELVSFERHGLCAESLGLKLEDSKALLTSLQKVVVQQQVNAHLEEARACPECDQTRKIKGDHDVVFRSVFGKLIVKSPRWHHCDCQSHASKTFSPLAQLLPERTTPELLYLETKWASLVSYGMTANLIKDVLPVDDKLSAMTIRNHLQYVAQKSEDDMAEEQFSYVDGCLNDWAKLPLPNGPLVVGLDGGYVKSTRKGKWFEVVAGKSMLSFERQTQAASSNDQTASLSARATSLTENSQDSTLNQKSTSSGTSAQAKCFGFVHTYDEKAKRRLYDVLASQGLTDNQKVIFLSDGGESLKDLQMLMSYEAEHVLDWFHITMRLTVLKQTTKGLPKAHIPILESREEVLEKIERIKHYLWHGNCYKALRSITSLDFDLEALHYSDEEDLPVGTAKKTLDKLYKYVGEFKTYIRNNSYCIPNYGEKYRNGERISTGFVESIINQVVSKRFSKKQQMRWTKKGAHLLLQTRTKVLNDDLEASFRNWYPTFKASASEVKMAA